MRFRPFCSPRWRSEARIETDGLYKWLQEQIGVRLAGEVRRGLKPCEVMRDSFLELRSPRWRSEARIETRLPIERRQTILSSPRWRSEARIETRWPLAFAVQDGSSPRWRSEARIETLSQRSS